MGCRCGVCMALQNLLGSFLAPDWRDLTFHLPSQRQLTGEPSENSFPVSKIILETEEDPGPHPVWETGCLLKIGDRSFTFHGWEDLGKVHVLQDSSH